jgi:hypothetical protein
MRERRLCNRRTEKPGAQASCLQFAGILAGQSAALGEPPTIIAGSAFKQQHQPLNHR